MLITSVDVGIFLCNQPVKTSATLIDYLWTDDNKNINQSYILLNNITDHFPCVTNFYQQNIGSKKSENCKTFKKRKFTENNKQIFLERLRAIDWKPVYDIYDGNLAYKKFYEIYFNIYDTSFPVYVSKAKPKSNNVPYITEGLKHSIRESKRLHRLALEWPLTYKEKYIKYNKTLKDSLKTAKNLYYNNMLKDSHGDPKRTWLTINNILKRNSNTQECDITVPDNVKNIPNYINDFFLEAVDNLKRGDDIVDQNTCNRNFRNFLNDDVNYSMHAKPLTENEVLKYCNEIKTQAVGFDDISPSIMKLGIHYILKPLTYLVNQSFKTGSFPEDLKIAKVIAIHKSGNRNEIRNKRPISILNAFSKVYEKAIHNRLSSFLEKHSLIVENQHGFRYNHSTESAVLNFTKHIYEALNSHKYSIGVFLDFSKAFECIEHDILIAKLENLGIRGNFLALLSNYLKNEN